ncbi:MAG: circadian clock KaiB family protein [Motilibacteraceae bacterium]
MTVYRFRLYVMGRTARSQAAEEQLRALCRERLGERWRVEVVDVRGRPDLADAARIVATPTLDRLEPEPLTRVIGDLSSAERLAAALDLPARGVRSLAPHGPGSEQGWEQESEQESEQGSEQGSEAGSGERVRDG